MILCRWSYLLFKNHSGVLVLHPHEGVVVPVDAMKADRGGKINKYTEK
jgi:hypothetical protein